MPSGSRLDYHWFVHAQMAADHWATGLSTQLMLRELMPAAMMALTVLARRFHGTAAVVR